MKIKHLLPGLVAVGVMSMAINASALAVGDDYYLGKFTPPQPSGQEAETQNVQNLINWFNGDTYDPNLNGRVFTLGTLTATPDIPDATFGSKDETGGNEVDVTGLDYVLGKYKNLVAHVWYVGNLTGLEYLPMNQLDADDVTQGLSHISKFTGTDTPPPGVPDGGATALLLGLGMTGVVLFRRRKA